MMPTHIFILAGFFVTISYMYMYTYMAPPRIEHPKLGKVLVNRHKVQFESIINLVKGGHAMHRRHTSQRSRFM